MLGVPERSLDRMAMTDAFERPTFRPAVAVALAVLSGVLTGLSQPLVFSSLGATPIDPTGLTGLLAFVSLVPTFVAMRDASVKRVYWLAFTTINVWMAIQLYWLVVAMTVFGHIHILISIACLLLLSSVIAFALALAFAIAKLVSRHYGVPFWGLLPFAFGGGEIIRNYGPLGGFPWGNLGNSLATVPLFLQTASLVGVYGLVMLLTAVNAALAECIVKRKNTRRIKLPLAVAGSIVVVMAAYGGFRLSNEPDVVRTIKVGLLQGNIEQGIKNEDKLNSKMILERYHALQTEAVQKGVDVVVWPEASFPGGVPATTPRLRGTRFHSLEEASVPPAGVFGASVRGVGVDPVTGKRVSSHYNSAIVADGRDLDVRGRFDKVHLVPFGEYVPWPFFVAVKHLVPGMTTPGKQFEVVDVSIGGKSTPIAATICYEGVFPEISRNFANAGARLMFNVTNDAWYGVSSAAYQHLMMYAVRAVETARPVARAANTGISAVIDTRGRVHGASSLYETTVVVEDVAITDEWTLYLTIGDTIPFLSCVVMALLWYLALLGPAFWRRPRKRTESVVGYLGLVVAFGLLMFHFVLAPPGTDEAASTRNQLIFIAASLIGVGALSGRPWGRNAQRWTGGLMFAFCLIGPFVDTPITLVPSLVGLVIFLVASRRKREYVREAETQVAYRDVG
jgi:apolipoprotein N-acyltransferase